MKTTAAIVLSLAALAPFVSGCAPSNRTGGDAALTASAVPSDFWLSITVMGPVRSGPNPYTTLGAGLRPGRYVLESDRILRAAIGPAANDGAFPPQTRRLTQSEVAEIWTAVRSSDVLMPDHPNSASTAPHPDTVQGQTIYVITTSAGGRRQTVVVPVEPTPGPMADRTKPLIEKVASLAWVK